MAIVTGDRYLEKLVKFVEEHAGPLIEGTVVLKLNPAGLHYVQSRLEALHELESLLAGAPVDYLRAYISDLGDHRALEQLRRILLLLTALKVVSVLPPPARDPTPLSLLPFGRLRILELRGCDLSTSAARGLLELRHTLEKIICHNSTDALRHVFASRIAEIKESPQWNRLSFVSCACNRLVLMDESLQLLPAVETLDLSRNKFAKVDNLRKCTKLRHLDLGFNQLRSVASFSEVSCHIVKLVLRNNALTTLRGIENLKSLEGLDVSYNIISNFSELEFLAGLLSLRSLWFEGNPLCCARWYRAQVYSYFSHPHKLKLDDKEISTREVWKRQLIIASRQKRPASFGFYSPAKDDAEGEGGMSKKKRKASRLASIESEEESTYVYSDQDSASCDNEVKSRELNAISDDEPEIVDLINRVERMKKERSLLWLREFKEWMDHSSENFVDGSSYGGATFHPRKRTYNNNKNSPQHLGESSKYVSDSIQASGDESSTNILESDNSFADTSTGFHSHQYFDHTGSLGIPGGLSLPGMDRIDLKQEHQKSYSNEGRSNESEQAKTSYPDLGGHRAENPSLLPLASIDDIVESHLSFTCPGSPPHYQEDILHRRHNLVEEILQLSAESFSVASSDSNTSCSEEDFYEPGPSIQESDQLELNKQYLNRGIEGHSSNFSEEICYDIGPGTPSVRENGGYSFDPHAEKTTGAQKILNPDQPHNNYPAGACHAAISLSLNQQGEWFEQRKNRRKPKKRVVSLLEDENKVYLTETSNISDGNLDACVANAEDKLGKPIVGRSCNQTVCEKQRTTLIKKPLVDDTDGFSGAKCSYDGNDDFIKDYFNNNVADMKIHEICVQCVRCICVLEQEAVYNEREVALLLSSENKLYVLLIDVAFGGSVTVLNLVNSHKVEDVREVVVGLGLQVVRVCIEGVAPYLFIARIVEISRQLFCILQVFDSFAPTNKFSMRSLEQVQVELFHSQIRTGTRLSIFQYAMVHFWFSSSPEGSWVPRSLFVSEGHVLLCIEDLMQFGSLSADASCPSYISLDSCCSIMDVNEMVLESGNSHCMTLSLERASSEFCPSTLEHEMVEAIGKEKIAEGPLTWKIKWFSEESLFKFVVLLKAMRRGTAESSFLVRLAS